MDSGVSSVVIYYTGDWYYYNVSVGTVTNEIIMNLYFSLYRFNLDLNKLDCSFRHMLSTFDSLEQGKYQNVDIQI